MLSVPWLPAPGSSSDASRVRVPVGDHVSEECSGFLGEPRQFRALGLALDRLARKR